MGPPVTGPFVVGHCGSEEVEGQSLLPVLVHDFEELVERFLRPSRIAWLGDDLGGRGEQDHRHGPLGMCRREQDAERPSLRPAEERGPLRSGGVQDRPDVVHALLERGELGDGHRIGHSGSPFVQKDHAGERGETLQESRVVGLFPHDLDVGDESRNQYMSSGPSPNTWYAMCTFPLFAYRVWGRIGSLLCHVVPVATVQLGDRDNCDDRKPIQARRTKWREYRQPRAYQRPSAPSMGRSTSDVGRSPRPGC